MLKPELIKKEYKSELIELSPLIVRGILDITDDGVIESAPELQFQTKNISGKPFSKIEVEVNYYDNKNEFCGSDSDLRIESLSSDENHTFSLFIDPPDEVVSAELKIEAKKQTLTDKIPFGFQMAFIGICVAIILYSDFKG